MFHHAFVHVSALFPSFEHYMVGNVSQRFIMTDAGRSVGLGLFKIFIQHRWTNNA
jgi:hypothetical protein